MILACPENLPLPDLGVVWKMQSGKVTNFDCWEMVSSDVFTYIFSNVVLFLHHILSCHLQCMGYVDESTDPLQVPNLVDVGKVFT